MEEKGVWYSKIEKHYLEQFSVEAENIDRYGKRETKYRPYKIPKRNITKDGLTDDL